MNFRDRTRDSKRKSGSSSSGRREERGPNTRIVIEVFAAPPTGRDDPLGMLSQDGASLCPPPRRRRPVRGDPFGLFSCLPYGKAAVKSEGTARILGPHRDKAAMNGAQTYPFTQLRRVSGSVSGAPAEKQILDFAFPRIDFVASGAPNVLRSR